MRWTKSVRRGVRGKVPELQILGSLLEGGGGGGTVLFHVNSQTSLALLLDVGDPCLFRVGLDRGSCDRGFPCCTRWPGPRQGSERARVPELPKQKPSRNDETSVFGWKCTKSVLFVSFQLPGCPGPAKWPWPFDASRIGARPTGWPGTGPWPALGAGWTKPQGLGGERCEHGHVGW